MQRIRDSKKWQNTFPALKIIFEMIEGKDAPTTFHIYDSVLPEKLEAALVPGNPNPKEAMDLVEWCLFEGRYEYWNRGPAFYDSPLYLNATMLPPEEQARREALLPQILNRLGIG